MTGGHGVAVPAVGEQRGVAWLPKNSSAFSCRGAWRTLLTI